MAKKQKSFADKAMSGKTKGHVCPKCNEAFSLVLVVDSGKNEDSGSWKFMKTMMKVCKCNESNVYA